MEYRIWSTISMILNKLSVSGQRNTGLIDYVSNFSTGQKIQLALALSQQPSRCVSQIFIDISRMAHEFMNSRIQIMYKIRERARIQKARLRDAVETVRTKDRRVRDLWTRRNPRGR